jgi:hypothetical protein
MIGQPYEFATTVHFARVFALHALIMSQNARESQ